MVSPGCQVNAQSRSALDAVELMNVGVQFLREHMPSDCRIHYAIVNGGGVSPNVVQPEASVLYMVRSVSEIAEIAESNHMSAGRAALIEKICKAHEEFAFDQLAKNNIQTINQLFEYISLPDKLFRTGTAAATVPDDCKDKLGLDGLSGEEIISFTHAISDFYDKLCEYYDESAVANRIGYAFDIACGKNKEGAKLWGVVAENLTNEYDSRCAFFSEGEDAVSDWYSNSHFKQFADYITSSLT